MAIGPGDTAALAADGLALVDRLTTDEGWPLASAAPGADEPLGRYACLFGRDSLIASLQVRAARPALAEATLRVLAECQGTRYDEATREEPGRILHEDRPEATDFHREHGWAVRPDGGLRYYGTIDATPLFLVVAAEVGFDGPAVTAARAWLDETLAGDDLGLLRYVPHYPGGLPDQGWRDGGGPFEGSGIAHPDGRRPDPPVAVASAQAFGYAALRTYRPDEAEALADRVDALFFDHGAGWPALALEGPDGRAVQTLASEIGMLLWSGVLRPSRVAGAVDGVRALMSGSGLWTISPDHPAFRPDAYHLGLVWPFENWFAWRGLLAAGEADLAERLRVDVLTAVRGLGGMPECYAVEAAGAPPRHTPMANRQQLWTGSSVWSMASP